VRYRRTQSSHLSQWQLSTALLKIPLSPQYRTTHHSSTSPLTSVKSRLKLQFPLRSSFLLPCTAGRMRYRKKALPSRHAWCVKLSGSEYAPTGMPYSSYVVIVCQRNEGVAGAAFLRKDAREGETLRSREHVACVMLKGGLGAACSWSGENAARVPRLIQG